MEKLEYVFVVLVYRNIDVLQDFFESIKIQSRYKTIIVNSYYDDDSLHECEIVAKQNHADFIPVENRGYGYGNNIGVKYAMEHYEYDYLILSNSDIHILDFSFMDKLEGFRGVIAPKIQMITGKMQNPNIPWEINSLYPMLNCAYQKNSKILLICAHLLTRLSRELFFVYEKLVKKDMYRIFCCHGAFIIFSADSVNKLYPMFDEQMFLYNEELYLAFLCRSKGVNIYYTPLVRIEHLEGASTHSGNERLINNNKQSFRILYEHIKNNDF